MSIERDEVAAAVSLELGGFRLEAARIDPGRLRVRMILIEAGSVVEVKEQELTTAALATDDPATLEARARRRLEAVGRLDPHSLAGWMPWDLLRAPTPFRPVGPFDEPDARLWHCAVLSAINSQAHEGGFEARFETLSDWRAEAVTTYFLWLAEATLGGNGLVTFLLQADVAEVMGVLEALEAAECQGLARRYREALGYTRTTGAADFMVFIDEEWLDARSVPFDPASPRPSIDHWREGGTYWFVKHELRPALVAYVQRHRAVLVAG